MNIVSTIVQLAVSLAILVIVHECGHFLLARIFKVRVEKFYLFFNPWFSLFKYKPKNSETEYGIGWIPFGGYVKIAGMVDESLDREQLAKPPQPDEFRTKPAWQRLLIMIAGVVFNFLLAIAIYSGILYHWGEEYIPLQSVTAGMDFSPTAQEIGFCDGDRLLSADGIPLERFDENTYHQIINAKAVKVLRKNDDGNDTITVSIPADFITRLIQQKKGFASYRIPFVVKTILKDSPAAKAGLINGDSVVAINDTAVFMQDCIAAFALHKGEAVRLTIFRNGKQQEVTITPDKKGKIGVYMKGPAEVYPLRKISYNLLEAIPAGIQKGVKRLTGYVSDMKYVFTKEGFENLGGFGTIAGLFPVPFDARLFWEITALLSIILAFMNILPLPALDGGHVLFLLYEIVTRRKPSDNFLEKAQVIGMILLFSLLIFANLNDIFR